MFNIRFAVYTREGEQIRFFINIEIQKRYPAGYDLVEGALNEGALKL